MQLVLIKNLKPKPFIHSDRKQIIRKQKEQQGQDRMRKKIILAIFVSSCLVQSARAEVLSVKFKAPVKQFDKSSVHLQIEANQFVKIPREFFKDQKLEHMKPAEVQIERAQFEKIEYYKE